MAQCEASGEKAQFIERYGPYGRQGALTFDFVLDKTERIKAVRVGTGGIVDGMGFDIEDKVSGKVKTIWYGGVGHETIEIRMTPTEYVTQISGSTCDFDGDYNRRVVGQIYIHTNIRPGGYGPYGHNHGNRNVVAFKSAAPSASVGPVVGFFGRTGNFLESVGVSTLNKKA